MRELTGIPDSDLESHGGALAYFYFIKIVFPSPTGTLRWCNHPAEGLDAYTGNIDGTSQAWNVTRPNRVLGVSYGREAVLENAHLQFANRDDYFTTLKTTHGTLRGHLCEVYRAHFQVTLYTDGRPPLIGALKKSKRIFRGETDRASRGEVCGIALKPGRAPWASNFPKGRITKADFPYLSNPDVTFNWGDVQIPLGTLSQGAWGTWSEIPNDPLPRAFIPISISKPRKTTTVGFR